MVEGNRLGEYQKFLWGFVRYRMSVTHANGTE